MLQDVFYRSGLKKHTFIIDITPYDVILRTPVFSFFITIIVVHVVFAIVICH